MIMKSKLVVVAVLSLVVASLSVAGCAVNTSNPTGTPTPQPDYSSYIGKQLAAGGWTSVSKISRMINNTYVGTYYEPNEKKNESNVKFELFNDESAAKAHYGQLVLDYTNKGYTVTTTGITNEEQQVSFQGLGKVSAAWAGYKISTSGLVVKGDGADVVYGYNNNMNQWYVGTITKEIFA
jgi:hypothetical protein